MKIWSECQTWDEKPPALLLSMEFEHGFGVRSLLRLYIRANYFVILRDVDAFSASYQSMMIFYGTLFIDWSDIFIFTISQEPRRLMVFLLHRKSIALLFLIHSPRVSLLTPFSLNTHFHCPTPRRSHSLPVPPLSKQCKMQGHFSSKPTIPQFLFP